MKNRKYWIVQLLIALLVILVGIIILVRRDLFKQIFIITLGVAAIVVGIEALVTMNRYSFSPINYRMRLIKGVLGIIIGVLAIVMPLATAETIWAVIIYILAAQILYGSIIAFSDAIVIKKKGFTNKFLIWEGVVSLVIALLLFISPKAVADLIITIVGTILVVAGVGVALTAVLWVRKRGVEVEVEFEEVQ